MLPALLCDAARRGRSIGSAGHQQLALLQRCISTFPSWLPEGTGGFKRISTPLTQPLPGVVEVPAYRAPSQPPATEVTVLPNGVRIISEASPVSEPCNLMHACMRTHSGTLTGCSTSSNLSAGSKHSGGSSGNTDQATRDHRAASRPCSALCVWS